MAPPTACNRSAGPAVEPVPVRPRHVVDAFGSVSYPRIPLRRPAILSFGGVPQVCRRGCGGRRAQRERGCPRRLPGSPGRGLCLFAGLPAHRAEGPQPPHELGGGGGVRLRRGMPGEHLAAPGRRSEPFLPCILTSSGTPEPLGISLGWWPAGRSTGPLDRQPPDERVAGPADPAEAHGVGARPLLRGEAEVGRHLPAGAEPREVADLGREGGGEREPAPLDRLERLDLGREGARRDGGPVLGEEGLPLPRRPPRPRSSAPQAPGCRRRRRAGPVEPPEEAVRPVPPGLPAGVVPP